MENLKNWFDYKYLYERLLRIRGKPREIALGFSLGIFLGMTPFIGVQAVSAVLLASLFKWNKISAAIGVFITNPLTAPVLYSITYYVGIKVLGIENGYEHVSMGFDISSFFLMLKKAPDIIWILFVGGFVVGLPASVACYYFTFQAVKKYQEDIRIRLQEKKALLAEKKKKKKQNRTRKKQKEKTSPGIPGA